MAHFVVKKKKGRPYLYVREVARVDGKPKVNRLRKLADYPATSQESDRMSRELKRRGFKFVGSTICYAHMQATGMVNDHALGCFRRQEIIAQYPA